MVVIVKCLTGSFLCARPDVSDYYVSCGGLCNVPSCN